METIPVYFLFELFMKRKSIRYLSAFAGIIIVSGIIMAATSSKLCTAEDVKYKDSPQYHEGQFVNSDPVNMSMSFKDMLSSARKYFSPDAEASPAKDIPVQKVDVQTLIHSQISEPQIVWFGHSTFFLRMDGKNILIDPMLGQVPAPVSWMGKPRFSKEIPISAEEMPHLDVVLISHDHYDHLDKESIIKIKDKVASFYVPLGVSEHLIDWGVDQNRIHELDWGDDTNMGNLKFICAPAQHFSGRSINDRNKTLWCSWIISSENYNIYFSGDGGYNTHFKEIGETYGPFDLALIECGQYNRKWKDIHMFPEESVQAALDLKARIMMPIHWGGFNLAEHSWKNPIERVTAQAKNSQMPILTPAIGEILILNKEANYTSTSWWEDY